MALRALHLVGSPTGPAWDELSRLYARGCLAALDGDPQITSCIVHVGPDGVWRFPDGLDDDVLAWTPGVGAGAAIAQLVELNIDVMVPHMFCPAGMTDYRSLFELLGIPFLGNRAATMALTARKDLARTVVAGAGVAVPEAEVLTPGQAPRLRPPVVVKPVGADNSDGVALVRDPEEYPAALAKAGADGTGVLVERFIPAGREVRCGILDHGDRLEVLPLEEYPVDPSHPIRTAADKLGRDPDGGLTLVAKGAERAWIVAAGDPIGEPVAEAARRAHRALGCRHYSLFDFRIAPSGDVYFLEAGLYCSFSPQSVVATMAAATGRSVPDLFRLVAGRALAAPALSPSYA